jgi:hypothetical protein
MSDEAKQPKLRIHEFRHRGNTYHVCFEELDGQQFAAVYASEEIKRPLVPFPDELPSGLSPQAIRRGYIAVAEWLVTNDKWPDAHARAALSRGESLMQAA